MLGESRNLSNITKLESGAVNQHHRDSSRHFAVSVVFHREVKAEYAAVRVAMIKLIVGGQYVREARGLRQEHLGITGGFGM